MTQTRENRTKQNMVMGALTGSAGIFITKALGLFYYVPFYAMIQDENVFYGYAYTIYNYALNICLAGLPYAIATLVAKYMAREEYGTVMLVKKLSRVVMSIFGVISCMALILLANPISRMMVPDNASPVDLVKTRTVLIIVSFALVAVPILSYYRGFYQGMKEIKTYAFTQVLEQLIRVCFLLGAGALCVYLFKTERIWAVYMAVISTSLSAVGCIVYFVFYDRRYMASLPFDLKAPSRHNHTEIFKEMMSFAIPYLLSSVISNSSNMFVVLMFKDGMQAFGMEAENIKMYQGLITTNIEKLTAIPQILAIAFPMALVPHLSGAIAKDDAREARSLIHKALVTVGYLAVPLILYMIIFARPLYYGLLGNNHLTEATHVLRLSLAVQYLWIPICVVSSIMITMRMNSQYLILEAIRTVLVLITFRFWLSTLGVNGYYVSKTLEFVLFMVGSMYLINRVIRINYRYLTRQLIMIAIGCVPMLVLGIIIAIIGYDITIASRLVNIIYLGITGILCVAGYIFLTGKFGLPQYLFGIELNKEGLIKFIKSFR